MCPCIEGEQDREELKALVSEGQSREHFVNRAECFGARAFGVIYARRAWAVRVLTAHYANLVKELLPEDAAKLTAEYFEVSGIASKLSRRSMQALIREWTGSELVRPSSPEIKGFQSWIVRAPAPPLQNRIQASFGILTIEKPRER